MDSTGNATNGLMTGSAEDAVGRMSETIQFDEAIQRLPTGRLRVLMPDLVGDVFFVDRSGTVTDDLSSGMYGYEFEEYVCRKALAAVARQLYSPEWKGAPDLEEALLEVRDMVYEQAYDSLLSWSPRETSSAVARAAEVLSAELSDGDHEVEVVEPTWADLVCTLVENGTYQFDFGSVDDIVMAHEFRCELLLGHDGVHSGDPLTNGDVERLLTGDLSPADFSDTELRDTPVLAFARAQGLSLDDLKEGARVALSRDRKGLVAGERVPLSPAERIFEEVREAPHDSICQVGVLCRMTLADACAALGDGGDHSVEIACADGWPLMGLYDRFSGAGGVFALEAASNRVVLPGAGAVGLAISQAMFPEAGDCPWYTIDDCYGLAPSAYDAHARTVTREAAGNRTRGNEPLSRSCRAPGAPERSFDDRGSDERSDDVR